MEASNLRSIVDALMQAVRAAGITIKHDNSVRYLGVFSGYDNCIILNRKLNGKLYDFVFLHEYMHYQQYLDETYVPVDNKSHEYDCDRRVVEFLLSKNRISDAEEYADIVLEHRGFDFREKIQLYSQRTPLQRYLDKARDARPYEVYPQEI